MLNKFHRIFACGLAALAISTAEVLAQTDEIQTNSPASSKTEEISVSDATTNTKPAQTEVKPAQTPASPSTKTVLDYEASEQISEDFSVSFPVDI
jgi:hypothetical protein